MENAAKSAGVSAETPRSNIVNNRYRDSLSRLEELISSTRQTANRLGGVWEAEDKVSSIQPQMSGDENILDLLEEGNNRFARLLSDYEDCMVRLNSLV